MYRQRAFAVDKTLLVDLAKQCNATSQVDSIAEMLAHYGAIGVINGYDL